MIRQAIAILALLCASTVMVSESPAHSSSPAPGYYDIPPGFDFPADKQKLEDFVVNGDVRAMRLHVWNVFAGITKQTPNKKFAIFETWYSEDETFQTGVQLTKSGPRRITPRFRVPDQMQGFSKQAMLQAGGTALLSEVMFNYANYHHIRDNKLNLQSTLDSLAQTGDADADIPGSRTVPPFPADSVSLKTIWWPIKANGLTPLPVWDPAVNAQLPGGNPYSTWVRVVAVDPTRVNISDTETTNIAFLKKPRPDSHVVSLKDRFHFLRVDAEMAATAMNNPRLKKFSQDVLGRPLQAGDYVAFLGTHMTTKEIGKWVWATFWWHDRPSDGPFSMDRPAAVTGVWRNYLMSESYDVDMPHEQDGSPHIAYNPCLEAHFENGVVSNCMSCHNRATTGAQHFLPIKRGKPDLTSDSAFAHGSLRTDFLWSLLFNAH